MKDFLQAGGVTGDVVVVLFGKVNLWPGGTTIQTAGRTTTMLFNPDIPETAMLRETTSQAIIPTQLTISRSGNSDTARESFLDIQQKYTLTDIKLTMEVSDFVATAVIDYIFQDLIWWYYACRVCNRKCKDEDDLPNLYYCPGCDKHVAKVTRKFLLKLLLVDETDSLTVVLFDTTVRSLIGKSAEDIFSAWNVDNSQGSVPKEVAGLQGRAALWQIQAEQKDGDRYPRPYRVRAVSEDQQLIKAYNDKWAGETKFRECWFILVHVSHNSNTGKLLR